MTNDERRDPRESGPPRRSPQPPGDPESSQHRTDEVPRPPDAHPTVHLPRGTGGQRPTPRQPPPLPHPTEQARRPQRPPAAEFRRGGPRQGSTSADDRAYREPPRRDAGRDYRGGDYPASGYPDADYSDREPRYRDSRRRDSRDSDYRDSDYRDSDYRDSDYRDSDYRDSDYRDWGSRDSGSRDSRYRDSGSRGSRYGDSRYRESEYPDADYPRPESGYPDSEYRARDSRRQDYRDTPDRDYRDTPARDYDAPHQDPHSRPADSRRRGVEQSRTPRTSGAYRPETERRAGDFDRPHDGGSHLPPYKEPDRRPPTTGPRKLTVTRVAALRSRELTSKGVEIFRKAATADGADRSGLTHLTYAVMANYAVDAALTVALANTLFFAAASAESTGKVLLYLLITVAPFAVIAPFIGPLLDRVQNGRRVALAITSFGRALLAVVMAFNFDSWILYPCALGMMVLSKSFGVLKAALTPRVLPEQITLVKTNSRLTVFGLLAGGVSGALAAGFAALSNSSGALLWTAICGLVGGVLCLRIPSWVESTAGEVPVHHSEMLPRKGKRRQLPHAVSATLWANMANRIETGFLALFIAFVVKTEYADVSGFKQLLLLGIVGAAAGVGGFLGNALGAKLALGHPEKVAAFSVMSVAITTFIAILIPGLAMGAIVGLVGSTSSSLAKVCLDSVLQQELPEASRASAFGMTESALQLAWVGGGVVGLLLGGVLHVRGDGAYMLGFGVVTLLVAVGLVQSFLRRSGRSLFAGLPGVGRKLLHRSGTKSAGQAATEPFTQPYQQPPTRPDPTHPEPPTRKKPPRRAGDPR